MQSHLECRPSTQWWHVPPHLPATLITTPLVLSPLLQPKMQSHLECRLWNEIFVDAQKALGIPNGELLWLSM